MAYTNDLKQFARKPLLIKDVYPFYRAGGVEIGGKFVFKSFHLFPKAIEDETILNNDPRAVKVENERDGEWREKVWDKDEKVFKFTKVGKKTKEEWSEWRKVYKKVLDIFVELEEPMSIHMYKDKYADDSTAVIQGISASKVQNIIQAILEPEIPMEEGKLRDGTIGQRPVFDWEDAFLQYLVGKSFSFTVTGAGLDTKYSFKEKAFNKKATETDQDDFPF